MSIAINRKGRRAVATPKIEYISSTKWDKGIFSRIDSDRVPLTGLVTAENVQLNQDGIFEPRPGLKLYGVQPQGIILGQIYEYVLLNTSVTPNVPETWLIWMENRAGVGTVVTNKNGGVHQVVTGKTYSVTVRSHFEQVFGNVVITNSVDSLSYMVIASQTITVFTILTTPASVVATATTGLTTSPTGYLNIRYRAAAANQGETAASSTSVVAVNKPREQWNGTTETVTITGTVQNGTTRVNIYAGSDAGFEFFVDSVSITAGATSFTYTDTGKIAENPNRIAPVGDSTTGPKLTRVTNIKGVPYGVGDSDNLGRIWYGGNGASALDFSSYNGGGWVEPNKGGKDFPVIVKPFRDGKGTPTAVCFSKGTNGVGKRYLLQPATTTLGTTLITYMSVQEDNGQDGTDSPDAVVMINDGAYYPSRTGFKTSNTKANIQNIISTQGISDNIADKVTTLSSLYMDYCVGLAYDQRIFYSLPYSSTRNSEMWHIDLRQGSGWMRPWYVAADWLLLYADNIDGKTKFLCLVNNKICEFDSATATNDLGIPFTTNVGSGAYKFSPDGFIWGSVLDVTFVFLRAQGNINVSVTANTDDGLQTYSDVLRSSVKQSASALGAYGLGMIGLGNMSPTPTSYVVNAAKSRTSITVPVSAQCNYLNFGVSTTESGVTYQSAEVIVRYVKVGPRTDVG